MAAPRTQHLLARIDPGSTRIKLEHASIDLASAALAVGDVPRAFRTVADAAQTRRATPATVAATLAERPRVAHRVLLAGTGPVTSSGRSTYRDLRYAAYGVVVELDGRAFHDTAAAITEILRRRGRPDPPVLCPRCR